MFEKVAKEFVKKFFAGCGDYTLQIRDANSAFLKVNCELAKDLTSLVWLWVDGVPFKISLTRVSESSNFEFEISINIYLTNCE